jgi:nicotinate dehydrogenase subunit A
MQLLSYNRPRPPHRETHAIGCSFAQVQVPELPRRAEGHASPAAVDSVTTISRNVQMSTIALHVNGRPHTVDVDPSTPLLYVLSDDLGLRGPKFGCGLGQCGACAVIVGGRAVRSCIIPVSTVANAEITTLEGLGTPEHPHPIQQAFIDHGAAQCGFCLNGVIVTAKAYLDEHPKASPVGLELPILALIPGFGNVARSAASVLR